MSRIMNLRMLLVLGCAVLAAGCSKPGTLGVVPVTHLGVGLTVALNAYEEQRPSHIFRSATPDEPMTRETVKPIWSVSDATIASVDENGILKGLKPGQVTVKGIIDSREVTQTVQIVEDLRSKYLPQLTIEGQLSNPKQVSLSLDADRSVKFSASFDRTTDDAKVEQMAPAGDLPWSFAFDQGTLEITDAAGHAAKGWLKTKGGGKLSFTVWSSGEGAYPLNLKGKTVMVVGDSMADGLAWFMKDKVENAGGRFVGQAWNSSTTTAWAAEHRMRELVAQHQPDIVFLALGSNEVEARDLEPRGAAVRVISAEIGNRPEFWIGPPSWVPDKGIVKTIEANFRPGYFYNANDLKVPRRGDGKHPNRDGFRIWVDLIWTWFARRM